LSTFEPVVITALAALMLDEFLTPVQLAGGVLVLSSAALVQLRAGSHGRARPNEYARVRRAKAPSPVDCQAS
jgi:drug/metabolite transporter (DMT)-like permease